MSTKLPLGLLLALFLALGVIYSVITPIFEASDELSHYPVVKHLADGRGLPVQDPAVETAWKQEGSQPPLYYAVAALATAWIDTDDLAERLWLNPLSNIGKTLSPGNKNLVIHTTAEAFPWQGTALAVHLLRWLSLLLQTITVFATYRIASEIAPQRRDLALLAAALVAFNPMFLFIAASVNNDNLIVPLATLVLWLLVRTLRESWSGDRRVILLGVLAGLATLTKLSGLALLPLIAGVLTFVALRRRAWGTLVRWGAILAVLVAAIAGWWYLRNWRLYGDPTGLNAMLAIAGRRPESPTWRTLLGEFAGFRLSYWGVFGGFNVLAANWLYWFYDALTLAGLIGWLPLALRLRSRWRSHQVVQVLVLGGWILIVLVSLIRWTGQTYASQGRLIFPAISAIAILLACGLATWMPRRWQGRVWIGLGVLLGVLAATLPFTTIAPAYARPPLLTVEQLPPTAQRADVIHAGVLRLLAYELPQQPVRPGESAPVTIYWQTVAATHDDLSVFLHLLQRDGASAGQLGSYPGLGAYPTSLLRPGDIVRDTYHVPVIVSATAPSLLWVDVGLYHYGAPDETGLSANNSSGEPASGLLGTARLLPSKTPVYPITHPTRFDLGGQATLLGYDLASEAVRPGQTLTLTLYWQAQTRMTEDYHVFVHLVGPDGKKAAQGDKAPLDGDWPTWAWEPGYPVRDNYAILLPTDLPSGRYGLQVGLYRMSDFWRLPVQEMGESVKDSAVVLGGIEVN